MLFADFDVAEPLKSILMLASGGAVTALGAWIINVMRERREDKNLATADSIKRDRAKLSIDQGRLEIDQTRYDSALENMQRVYNNLYANYTELHKRVDVLQEQLLKSETGRVIAVTQLSESMRRIDELQKRIEYLEGKARDANRQ